MKNQMFVPRLSPNDDEMSVQQWHIADNEYVEKGQALIDLEYSKASVTVESEHSGYIVKHCQEGETIAAGALLATFSADKIKTEMFPQAGKDSSAGQFENAFPTQTPTSVAASKEQKEDCGFTRFSKPAEEFMKQRNISAGLFESMGFVDLETVIKHSGSHALENPVPELRHSIVSEEPLPVKDLSARQAFRNEPLSASKKAEINFLTAGLAGGLKSSVTVNLLSAEIRKSLTKWDLPDTQILPLILFELARLLEINPKFNAYFDDDRIVYYDRVNLGLAMDMGKGLKVPVVFDANRSTPVQLFQTSMDYVSRYMENRLSLRELSGGTFTVTDLSNDGVLYFQPLLNQKQAGILGIGGDTRLTGSPITLTLVFDHRLLSGRDASVFLNSLKDKLLAYGNQPDMNHSRLACSVDPSGGFSTDIAIIGMSARFPGANNIGEFWENLKAGKESITFFPDEELLEAGVSRAELDDPRYVKAQPMIEDVDCFDARFFKYSPREAELMDPQHRLLLECAWLALEDAGYAPDTVDVPTGVFLSVFWNMYGYLDMWLPRMLPMMTPSERFQAMIANDKDFIATRISYKLNLKGPSLCVQTACSSALVNVHLACQSLLTGECGMALAGGSSLLLPQKHGYFSQNNLIYSPDGHCRAFDAQAEGTIFGNGLGMVVLKRLEDAIKDKDTIYAVIKGSAINNDGSMKADFTAPCVQGQRDVILKALEMARVHPETIGYVEAHGTGTKIGDPLEVIALTQAYRSYTDKKKYCGIGSVKTNIGHLNVISGIPGLIKTVLALKHRQIPPTLHFKNANGEIDFENSPFFVNTTLREWEGGLQPRRAGVSSFGIGGTNAHIILEEAGEFRSSEEENPAPWYLLPFSAKTQEDLHKKLSQFMNWLQNEGRQERAGDISYTLGVGRNHFSVRCVFIAKGLTDLSDKLRSFMETGKAQDSLLNDLKKNPCTFEPCLLELGESIQARLKNGSELPDSEYREKMMALGDLYVKGYEFGWASFFAGRPYGRIPLPGYPFVKERYWVPQRSDNQAALTSNNNFPAGGADLSGFKKGECYYQTVWEGAPLPQPPHEIKGPFILFDHSDEWARAFREREKEIVLVRPGEKFKKIDEKNYEINPEQEDDFHHLFRDLAAHYQAGDLYILHAWNYHATIKPDDSMEDHLSTGLYSVFHISKAFMKCRWKGHIKWLYAYADTHVQALPAEAAIAGMMRCVKLENPDVECCLIRSDQMNMVGSAWHDLVQGELAAPEPSPVEVKYEDHVRYSRRIRPLISGSQSERVVLKNEGVYLITGGAGGLGLILADHLAGKYKAKLVLTGRSELTPEKQKEMKSIADHGGEVIYCKADVSVFEDMQRAVEETKKRFQSLNGVIHAAGIVRDARIIHKDLSEIKAVLNPKMRGTLNLDLATRDEKLDFFVMFSSIAASLGSPGQSDYAAGNAFLEEFARERNHLVEAGRRAGVTIAIAWPLWKDGGMRPLPASEKWIYQTTGIAALAAENGLEAFEQSLAVSQSSFIVMAGDTKKIHRYLGLENAHAKSRRESSLTAQKAPKRNGQNGPESIFGYLTNAVSRLLKIESTTIDSHADLEEYGADSIMVMGLLDEINEHFGLNLAPTEIFNHSTLDALARHIQSLVDLRNDTPVTPGHSNTSVMPHPFIDNVERLSGGGLAAWKSFSLKTDPMFYDHVVLGLPRLQAVSYLEMIYSASAQHPDFTVNHIYDLSLYYPISILEEIRHDSRTLLTPDPENGFDIEIMSRLKEETYVNAKAKGRKIELTPKTADIDDLKKQFIDSKPVDFDMIASQTNNFIGPYFYAFKEIYQSGHRIFGHLDLSEKAKTANHHFYLHPGLLDPCVYLAMGIAHDHLNNLGDYVYLPIHFSDVRIYSAVNRECYCLVETISPEVEDRKVLRYNLFCYGLDGKVLIEILGMDLKKVREDKKNETVKILETMNAQESYRLEKADIVKNW